MGLMEFHLHTKEIHTYKIGNQVWMIVDGHHLLFLKKSHWIPISEDMIVWYGDNFIKECNPYKKSILRGYRCETDMSTTCDLSELDEKKNKI